MVDSASSSNGEPDDDELADAGVENEAPRKSGTPVPEGFTDPASLDPGRVLFYEEGGSRWVILIGPVMIGLTLLMEILGGGRIHWEILTIFGVILVGFSWMQVAAARQHVSVELTESTLRQGARTLALCDITKVFPENRSDKPQKWESARALGELPAVPRRRKGVGVELVNGDLRQAWARDVDRFRNELSETVMAVHMGLGPGKRVED